MKNLILDRAKQDLCPICGDELMIAYEGENMPMIRTERYKGEVVNIHMKHENPKNKELARI